MKEQRYVWFVEYRDFGSKPWDSWKLLSWFDTRAQARSYAASEVFGQTRIVRFIREAA